MDVNRHIASSSYLKVKVDKRMRLHRSRGFYLVYFHENQLCLVVLSDQLNRLSLVTPAQELHVKMEFRGLSEDYKFLKFSNNLYGADMDVL